MPPGGHWSDRVKTLRLPSGHILRFVAATKGDRGALGSWKQSIKDESNPFKLASLELADLAFRRWEEARAQKAFADNAAELADRHYRLGAVPIATYVELQKQYLEAVEALLDTKREALEAGQEIQRVTLLTLAKDPQHRPGRLVGLVLFKRTWCNNICVQYIATHPLHVRDESSPLRGLGTALVYYVVYVANHIDAGGLWGEATQDSAQFYNKSLGRNNILDVVHLGQAEYMALKVGIEKKLSIAPSP